MKPTPQSTAPVTLPSTPAADLSRRDLVAKLLGVAAGGAALQALSGCVAQAGEANDENVGEALLAATGNGTLKYADSVTELRALSASSDSIAVLKGHTIAGDGGGGVFHWSMVAAPDDGGTILNAGSGNSAGWRRLYSGPLNVKWFGAKGDNSSDDSDAIDKAIQVGPRVVFPSGVYKVTGTIQIRRSVYLQGLGAASSSSEGNTPRGAAIAHAGGDPLFRFVPDVADAELKAGYAIVDLMFRKSFAGRAGCLQFLAVSEALKPSWIRIRNCDFIPEPGIAGWDSTIELDGNAAANGLRDFWLESCRIHTTSETDAIALDIKKGRNVFVSQSITTHDPDVPEAFISVSGDSTTNFSSQIFISACSISTLALDFAQLVHVIGGSVEKVTTTENTADAVVMPTRLVNPPILAGARNVVVAKEPAAAPGHGLFAMRTGPDGDVLIDKASQINVGDDGGVVGIKSSSTQPADTPPVGTIVFNRSPVPGGSMGWVYTASGWKTWGSIGS